MKIFIYQMTVILLISCGDKKEQEFIYEPESVSENSDYKKYEYTPTFYHPKPYDKHWRMNQPVLEKSEGWIKPNCDQKLKNEDSIRVIIKWQFIEHKSWGRYEGTLVGIDLKTDEEINFDFKCYIPDFDKGDWLNNRK